MKGDLRRFFDLAVKYPSEEEHEQVFLDVEDILTTAGIKIKKKRKKGEGFNGTFDTGEFSVTVRAAVRVADALMDYGFQEKTIDKQDLNPQWVFKNIYCTLGITWKGLYVYCERRN